MFFYQKITQKLYQLVFRKIVFLTIFLFLANIFLNKNYK